MATLIELITDIDRVIQDDSYDNPKLTRMLNIALFEVCRGVRMPDLSVTPPMPQLYENATLETIIDTPFVSLPDDFQRDVFFLAHTSRAGRIPVETSFIRFLRHFPGLNQSGTISMASVKGKKLYYQGIPEEVETLTIHYYREPARLVNNEDTPEGIPGELHERLLVNWVAWKVFEEIEQGSEGRKIDTNHYKQRYYEALHDLTGIIPIDGEPIIYEDAVSAEYCGAFNI